MDFYYYGKDYNLLQNNNIIIKSNNTSNLCYVNRKSGGEKASFPFPSPTKLYTV